MVEKIRTFLGGSSYTEQSHEVLELLHRKRLGKSISQILFGVDSKDIDVPLGNCILDQELS